MPLGSPSFPVEGDLMQASGGAFRPANLVLIGAYTFTAAQTIDLGTGALPAAVGASTLRVAQADAVASRAEFFGFGASAFVVRGRAASGTRSIPLALVDGVQFVNITSNGYDGTTWQDNSGSIQILSDGLWSGSNRGTYLKFTGTANGSTALGEWARLYRGSFLVGATAPVGSELVRFAGGSAPGTPGSTDVLIGAGAVSIGATTASTSTTTGALTVSGGIGVAGASFFGGTVTVDLGTGATGISVAGTQLSLFSADTLNNTTILGTFGNANGPRFIGYNVGGTRAAQSATANGSVLYSLQGRGFTTALTGTQSYYFCNANGLWSGTNAGTSHQWFGTLGGATSGATWMYLQGTTATDPFGTLGIGAAPTAGNGLLQLASGTTKAYGVAWGTDTFLYRSASGILDLNTGNSPTIRLATAANVYSTIIFAPLGADQCRIDGSSYGIEINGTNPRLNIGYSGNFGLGLTVNGSSAIGASALVGAERLRVAGGTAPGTPGSTDVTVGAGQIKAGGGEIGLFAAGGDATYRLTNGSVVSIIAQTATDLVIGTTTSNGISIRTNNTNAITIDTVQNVTLAGTVSTSQSTAATISFVSMRNTSASASAYTQMLIGNDASSSAGFVAVASAAAVGLAGANSLSIGTNQNAPLGLCTNGIVRLTVDGAGGITFVSANNITFDTGTGTKIGTGTTQKIGFWNATPVAQKTGYGTPTNAVNQGSFDATTITLPNLAAHVAQLCLDLKATGLIGA